MADGLLWFNDGPNDFIQRMSKAQGEIDDNVQGILQETVDTAVTEMQSIVKAGGLNPTQKGGARIDSGDMYDSIKGHVQINGRGRVQADFGFEGAPEYTMYQERGTRYIPPMLAYAQAQEKAIIAMFDKFDQGQWVPQSLRF